MARPADIESIREWNHRQSKHGERVAKVGETLDETSAAWRSLLTHRLIEDTSAAHWLEAWKSLCESAASQNRKPPALKRFLDESPEFQKEIDAFSSPGWLGAEDPHFCRQVFEEFNRILREQLKHDVRTSEKLLPPDHGSVARRLIASREPQTEEIPDETQSRPSAFRQSLIGTLEALGAGKPLSPAAGVKTHWRAVLTAIRDSLIPAKRTRTIVREPEYPARTADAFMNGAGLLGELPDDQRMNLLLPRIGDNDVELPSPVEAMLRQWVVTKLDANMRAQMRGAWWLATPKEAFVELRTPPKPRPGGFLEGLLWFFYRKRRLAEWRNAREAVIFRDPPEKAPANRAMWQVIYDGRDRCRKEAREIDEARSGLLSPLRGLHERVVTANRRAADALVTARAPRVRKAEEIIADAQSASHEALGARGDCRALLRRVDELLAQRDFAS